MTEARTVLIGRRREPLEQVTADTGGLILVGDAACPVTWTSAGRTLGVAAQHNL